MQPLKATLSLGDARTGLWCDRCFLPSVISFDVYMLTELGVGDPIPCTQCASCKT